MIREIDHLLKHNPDLIEDLGERLYGKITEGTVAFKDLTLQDCKDYIYEVTIVRTFDGFLPEKSVIHDNLAKLFPEIKFEESDSDLDHAGDIDYIGRVGEKAFGIQIKPITAQANFANYSISERMSKNFDDFEQKYGGKVFLLFSSREGNKKVIRNTSVIEEIASEINRLKKID